MKSFCFALLFALLFGVVVRADDAEKMDIKCPVKSKFFAKYIDGEKFLKNCNPSTLLFPLSWQGSRFFGWNNGGGRTTLRTSRNITIGLIRSWIHLPPEG